LGVRFVNEKPVGGAESGYYLKLVKERIRVLIADDERPARSFLAFMLRAFEDIEIVGEAVNGGEAVKLIEVLRPDLVFLDIRMPDVDGLEVVRLLPKPMPLIAFVSGYDECANGTRELNVIDYLLKPASASRLAETVCRVRDRLRLKEPSETEALWSK
jgi:two-component system, LytTR family, response regulator